MSSDSATRQWTLVLVLTALFLSLVVVGQIIARYGAAYWAAPREIAALLDSADSSLHENESYDRDVAKVARRDDKLRLGRLLGEIQRAGDDLREDLNNVLVIRREDADDFGSYTEKDDLPRGTERRRISSSTPARQPAHISSSPSPRLRTSARILWAAKRTHLEERLRRLDLLRMRFLVVYMSIVAATATAAAERVEKSAEKSAEIATTNAAAVTAATAARATSAAAATATTTARPQPRNTTTGRTSRASQSTSSSSSDDDSSCSSSSSSAANSPLMSATTPSMPTSPSVLAAATKKSTASIVAASIAAAAAAAVAAGDTDDVYYPSSPTSMPASPGFGTHPFLKSIEQRTNPKSQAQSQPPSPPATPQTGTDDFDSLRRKPPSRRVTTLGIRPPDATPEHNHRAGWMGVVQELQRSPLLHKRHTSIEMSMARR